MNFDQDEGEAEKMIDRKIAFDGMINWSGKKGERYAVVKVSDAETNQTFGRLQAKREDQVIFIILQPPL